MAQPIAQLVDSRRKLRVALAELGATHDPAQSRTRLASVTAELEALARFEETTVYPLVAGRLGEPAIARSLADSRDRVEQLLARAREQPFGSSGYEAAIRALTGALSRHLHDEALVLDAVGALED
jgi:hypothetical protein